MNDNTKVLDQNPVQPQAPIQPAVPVGGGTNKEVGRVAAPVSEFVRPSGAEIVPSIPPEVSEANVKVRRDKPNLTLEHRELGIDHAGPDVPVPAGPTGLVQISEKKDINSSATWLNALTDKIQKVMKLMGI